MAYVKEGLGDYTSSLYFLNLYYTHNPNQKVLEKMSEVANEHRLEGYQFNDREFFSSMYYKHYPELTAGLLLLFTLGALLLVYQKRKNRPTLPLAIVYAILMVFTFGGLHWGLSNHRGIIHHEALLMEAPSAGAKQLELIQKGHRVDILGKKDIWYRIRWKDQTAYVRENNLLVIK
ncbi:SH3 domain-containing protein [Rapidithrix thailandica]|uniref:SH3 domain-containing protein n=2 Tax=Rapidithrix thailandica TaxID=413964 RepID=A0AAW9S1X3_9BACT